MFTTEFHFQEVRACIYFVLIPKSSRRSSPISSYGVRQGFSHARALRTANAGSPSQTKSCLNISESSTRVKHLILLCRGTDLDTSSSVYHENLQRHSLNRWLLVAENRCCTPPARASMELASLVRRCNRTPSAADTCAHAHA